MTNTMQNVSIPGSNFKFSAVRPADLVDGASDYTLVTIVVDTTGSVYGFARELKSAVAAIIEASRSSPRANNLLIRLTTFNTVIIEVFGFKTLDDIDIKDIDDFDPDGLTALYDATADALTATEQYARQLYNFDFDTNAAVYVITDGGDNRSQNATPKKIAAMLNAMRVNEELESIVSLLIGVNSSYGDVKQILSDYADDAKFDEYVDIGDANSKNLARLSGYISRSISTQSQSLANGLASQSLSF